MDKYVRLATSAPVASGAADPLTFRPNLGDLAPKAAGVSRGADRDDSDGEAPTDPDGVYVVLVLVLLAFVSSAVCGEALLLLSHLTPNRAPPPCATTQLRTTTDRGNAVRGGVFSGRAQEPEERAGPATHGIE
jgi:hypothetical protein